MSKEIKCDDSENFNDEETGDLEEQEDVRVDSDSDKENNAHTEKNVSDGDKEDEINNEYESAHSEVPIDVFVPALQLEKRNRYRKSRSLDEGNNDVEFFS